MITSYISSTLSAFVAIASFQFTYGQEGGCTIFPNDLELAPGQDFILECAAVEGLVRIWRRDAKIIHDGNYDDDGKPTKTPFTHQDYIVTKWDVPQNRTSMSAIFPFDPAQKLAGTYSCDCFFPGDKTTRTARSSLSVDASKPPVPAKPARPRAGKGQCVVHPAEVALKAGDQFSLECIIKLPATFKAWSRGPDVATAVKIIGEGVQMQDFDQHGFNHDIAQINDGEMSALVSNKVTKMQAGVYHCICGEFSAMAKVTVGGDIGPTQGPGKPTTMTLPNIGPTCGKAGITCTLARVLHGITALVLLLNVVLASV